MFEWVDSPPVVLVDEHFLQKKISWDVTLG
jgi:hypothetical protein